MPRKTIEIATPGSRLSVKHGQLRVRRENAADVTIPIEDIGVLIVDDRQAIYSQAVFIEIVEAGGIVLVADRSHLPCGMMMPVQGHHELTRRHRAQVSLTKPRKKRLWQQLIRGKIALQAELLEDVIGSSAGLNRLVGRVKSGDPDNFEAQAAQRYWPRLFGKSFRRNREQGGMNALLNYGYTVLRSTIARNLVASGLLPSLGVFHHNRRNPFCLADDLLEPYRPIVDWKVNRIQKNCDLGSDPLEMREHRAGLLSVLNETVKVHEVNLPVSVAIERSARSLAICIEEKDAPLVLPSSLPLPIRNLSVEQ